MTVVTVAVMVVAALFVLLMIAEQRRWRRYQRASQELADRTNMARPAVVARRADTSTNGGLKMHMEDISVNGRAA